MRIYKILSTRVGSAFAVQYWGSEYPIENAEIEREQSRVPQTPVNTHVHPTTIDREEADQS